MSVANLTLGFFIFNFVPKVGDVRMTSSLFSWMYCDCRTFIELAGGEMSSSWVASLIADLSWSGLRPKVLTRVLKEPLFCILT